MMGINTTIIQYNLLIYTLDPKNFGLKLINDQFDFTLNFITVYHQEIMCEIIKFKARAFPYKDHLFSKSTVKNIKPFTCWLVIKNSFMRNVKSGYTATISSACIEEFFFNFWLFLGH